MSLLLSSIHIINLRPFFRFSRFNRVATVLAGVKAIEFALEHQETHFNTDIYHNASQQIGSEYNLTLLNGATHRHLRKEMKPGFSREIVAPTVPDLVTYVQQVARSWKQGQELDAMIAMSNLLMKQAGLSLLN